MVLGALSALLMVGAGCATLRLIGLQRDAVGLGLAAALGIASLAVLTTFAQQAHLPEPLIGAVVLGVCVLGLVPVVRSARSRITSTDRLTLAVLAIALIIPALVLWTTVSVQSGVPDYSYDGPYHVETVEAMRHGALIAGAGWYPTGFHGPVAALLSLFPWIDSATGVVAWAAGLTLVAPLVVFAFATAIWGHVRVGAAAALLLALTSTFPYGPQLYSEWPMAAGLVLVVALWTLCVQYLSKPEARVAAAAGLMAGALLVVHGTEVYTAAIGLVGLGIARWRTLISKRFVADAAVACASASAASLPYVPALMRWTATGGAVAVGSDYYALHQATTLHEPLLETLFWASSTSSGLLIDLPVRLALLGLGAWLALRGRNGRALAALSAVFFGLVALFRFVDVGVVRQVFALTLPWAVDGRLLMTVPILVAPLEGFALVWVGSQLAARARAVTDNRRALARRAVAFGIALGAASVLLSAAKFNLETSHVVTYSADDAAAFAWLRQHAQPGDVLMNDGAADAGIWAPYKADVNIVLPHSRGVVPNGPEDLVRTNLGALDTRRDVASAACALGIKYVYRGEAPSTSEAREFPSLDALRSNPALQEVFSSGDAAVFELKTRLQCA